MQVAKMPVKYSVVLPCKDEEKTIGMCIDKIRSVIADAEIIVVDNNSKDDSAHIARAHRATVIKERIPGYGAALVAGFVKAKGEYVIMCDADNTYNLRELKQFIRYADYDIVIGNRFNGKMRKNSMPLLHRYLGNPLLSLFMRIFFKIDVYDCHCGFRMIKKKSLEKLGLESQGMELASEMLIKAAKHKMKIKEVSISYHPRVCESKLNSFGDGWRHLKMMLLYSPNYLFLIPGLASFLLGLLLLLVMLYGPIAVWGRTFYIHPMILGSLLTILGYEVVVLWLYTKTYSITHLGESDELVEYIHKRITLEKSIILGMIIFIIGFAFALAILLEWIASGYGALDKISMGIMALTLILIGVQTIFVGFFLSILGNRIHG